MKNLSYSNSWNKVPIEIIECEKQKHSLKREPHPNYRCVTVSYCEKCGFKFLTDSSD